jgi:hypothetical protein
MAVDNQFQDHNTGVTSVWHLIALTILLVVLVVNATWLLEISERGSPCAVNGPGNVVMFWLPLACPSLLRASD